MTQTRGSTICLPRFATPRRPDRLTLGGSVGDVARRLGTPLIPWQQLVADVALELNPDGSFAYDEVDLTVPRQSGKTTLVKAKTVFRLVKLARSHGPQRSTYTAQTRQAARKKLEQDFAESLRLSGSFPEVPHSRFRPVGPTQWRMSLNNGSENIQFGTGSYWQIDALSRSAGHGDTLDDATIDEAFAHETDEAEAAMRPAQATRRDAQLWVLSTAGNSRSFYLYRKVLAGRAATETGDHGRVAFFEWSAPDDADPADPEVWRAASPALGYTISIDFLHGEWERAQRKGQEGIDTFRRAYLNQWPDPPRLDEEDQQWPIPREAWEATSDDDSDIEGRQVFALEVAEDRSWSAFAAAGKSTRGDYVHGVVVDYQRGTVWAADRAVELVAKWGGSIAIASASPAASLIPDLRARGVKVVEVSTADQAAQCGQLFDAVVNDRFRHRTQAALTIALGGAEKRPYGDAWLWSRRRSSVDISPLVAVTLAVGHVDAVSDVVNEIW